MITPEIRKFIELEKKKEEVKKYFEELSQATEAVIKQIGVNAYFQDPTDGTVYKTVIPEGRFVSFDKYGYIRTKRNYEKKGTLSVKEAKENGFEI
jgi:chaperonin GroEL (HSP60 family)